MKHSKVTLSNCLLIYVLLLTGCSNNKIETDRTLNNRDKEYIQSLHLLDSTEKIDRFFSEYKNKVAGNFFTDKRIAKYWIDERDKTKNIVTSAFYSEIKSIDTVYNADITYCPYMLVTKMDNSKFKVCVDGKREDIKNFFEEALIKWKQSKTAR